MRRGFDRLSAQVQTLLQQQPFSGRVLVFRGRRGDIVKLLWGTAMVYACSRSDLSAGASYGRRLRANCATRSRTPDSHID
ncbi:IS66 family insertion sequence element accessory protein TnpB [Acidobacterium sp. S8]|uniref:IS66 family insertion sequence element accessory protein TnpB n=1 Tax=Acidobacterium sp. S8 TaxID=1641854 RepID=UPI00352FAF90